MGKYASIKLELLDCEYVVSLRNIEIITTSLSDVFCGVVVSRDVAAVLLIAQTTKYIIVLTSLL